MNNIRPQISLAHFIEHFPEMELPITLNDESHHYFSQHNDPFPALMIKQYLLPIEGLEQTDEFSEYVPCFRLPKTKDFVAIVYWKAGLLTYQYTLVTFLKNGTFIDQRVIAGTFSDGVTITQSIATITADWSIYIMTGNTAGADIYDAANSKAIELDLLPDGTIVEEEN